MTKYIFVTGGVISGLGKGVISASIGRILKMFGEEKITIKKLDPYLNIDPGTLNPIEHGEVFVTHDGIEADLDLGYYERFLEIETSSQNSTSSGKLLQELFRRERDGKYLGKTVQYIPHFTDIIKEFICCGSDKYDYIICEIGGCVGDIEAMAFYEALRQLKNELGVSNLIFIHLTYLLHYQVSGELKTKPTQNSIRELQQVGITPDILICRTEIPMNDEIRTKLSLHTNLCKSNIIEATNVSSIYEVPRKLIDGGIDIIISTYFNINKKISTTEWDKYLSIISTPKKEINIGIVGKYIELMDSYKSLLEAIFHAGIKNNHKVNIHWINAREEDINISGVDGIIIPGGFGESGIENMLKLIKIIRERRIPTFGICLGMQLMVIEYVRNIIGDERANSEEFTGDNYEVIIKRKIINEGMGGTMRLGSKSITLNKSKLQEIYNKDIIYERHRHRYIINNVFWNELENHGCLISGESTNKSETIIEAIEVQDSPWYIGCQYHPEYKSRPFEPHPLFVSFIKASILMKEGEG